MMYSAYKLNKQGDNIQPWSTPFPIWNQSFVPCTVLNMPANLQNSAVATGLENVSFHLKKGSAKECSNYRTIALISHASKVMLIFSKPGFSNMWIMNFLMFKLVLEKAEEPVIKLPHPLDHRKRRRVPEKHLLCFIDYAKGFDCVNPNKLCKILPLEPFSPI